MDIIFISTNDFKFNESKRLFEAELKKLKGTREELDINLIRMEGDSIEELQTKDINELVEDKIRKAYDIYKRPVLVEHTVLNINCLNGYPDTQTSGFWNTISKNDSIKGELLCNIVNNLAHNEEEKTAVAKTVYCYCDGKNIIKVDESVEGYISDKPRVKSDFQWDTIFIPKDKAAENKSFAELELENKKDSFSMRAKAMATFVRELKGKYNKSEYNIGVDEKDIKDIASSIKQKKLVLFIGAGVSASLALSGWNKLIKDLGKELNFDDEEIFLSLGDNLELAEYYSLENENYIDRIVEYFKNSTNDKEIKNKIEKSEIHKLITELNIDTIYTTNYDHMIEKSFEIHNRERDYKAIYDLETLNESKVDDVQIIKLHGDLKEPDDIVLTQTSYYKRYDFENCLDIKLRNDLLTKSVLFIGYSFRDANIKYMMYKLNSIWKEEDSKYRPKSYIFLTENNPVQRKIIEEDNDMKTIVTENLNKSEALEEFLKRIVDECEKK